MVSLLETYAFRPRASSLGHSITSSARASTDGGRPSPTALALLRLITNSYLVGVPAPAGRPAIALEDAIIGGFYRINERTPDMVRRSKPGSDFVVRGHSTI